MQSKQSTEMLEVDEFIPYLRNKLALAGMDVAKFDRSLKKARDEADVQTRKNESDNKESFRLLREYLNAEQAEAKDFEKVIDKMIRGEILLSDATTPLAAYVSDSPRVADRTLEKFQKFQKSRTLLAENGISNG